MSDDIRNIADKLLKLEGTIKQRARATLETELQESIQKNFDVGGRPAWKPSQKKGRAQGTKTLVITGNLRRTQVESRDTGVGLLVTLTPGPLASAYSRIHQEGGTINMPARAIRHREKKYKDGRKRTVFASRQHKRITKETMTKPYTITIPPRPYLVIPPEDYQRIINAVAQSIKF